MTILRPPASACGVPRRPLEDLTRAASSPASVPAPPAARSTEPPLPTTSTATSTEAGSPPPIMVVALARLEALEAEAAAMTDADLAAEVERRATLRAVEPQVGEAELRRLARRMALRQRMARMKPGRLLIASRFIAWARSFAPRRRRHVGGQRRPTADPDGGTAAGSPPPLSTTKARRVRWCAPTGPPKAFAKEMEPKDSPKP